MNGKQYDIGKYCPDHRSLIDKTISQSPCTALMAGICLPLGLCKKTVSGHLKMMEISTSHISLQSITDWGNPNLYLHQPIKKGWYQPTRGLVSNPADSPNATRVGPCNSLPIHWPLFNILGFGSLGNMPIYQVWPMGSCILLIMFLQPNPTIAPITHDS